MKKVISIAMALVMMISVIIAVPTASAATSNGYKYDVLSNGTVKITEYTGTATSLAIPEKIAGKTVSAIGDYAFKAALVLKSVEIPATVTSLGDGVFAGAPNLTEIKVADANKNFTAVNGVLFDKAKARLIQYPAAKSGSSYSIPTTVNHVGGASFAYATNLKSVSIPNTVTIIGRGAFGFSGLTSVTIPSSVKEIKAATFAGANSLKKVTLPNSIVKIGDGAFANCVSMTSCILPSKLVVVEQYAFANNNKMTRMTIPDTVKTIGDYAFGYKVSTLTYKAEKVKTFILRGNPNTVAHKYAKTNGFTYQYIQKSVKFTASSVTLGVKQTYQSSLKYSPNGAQSTKNTYTSSNTKIATVNKNGVVKALAVGSATITVKANNVKATLKVEVKKAPSKVTVSNKTLTLKKKQSKTVTIKFPSGSYVTKKGISWSSSKPSVAKVALKSRTKATITAVKKGTAKITVKLYNNKKATIKVTVK
ncbi:MAG: leucine-rich repeat protein [Ruminococcus sp.]|nr:leucine-rich repeat protein [Ruminococcus sp.]